MNPAITIPTDEIAERIEVGADAMTPAEILRKAADIIEPEGCWTQGVLARDQEGKPTALARDAVCWSADGAIYVAARGFHPAALEALGAAIGFIATWNDAPNQTQANVVATLRSVADKLDRGAS